MLSASLDESTAPAKAAADEYKCYDCKTDQHQVSKSAAKAKRRLQIAAVLCLLFMITEAVGGIVAGSLAILTDAAHLFSDLIGFSLSILAIRLSSNRPTQSHSYGFHRAEIIGALVWVFLIWTVTLILMYEAIGRMIRPQPVDGKLMLIVAIIGFVVNAVAWS
jgi:zinc transporter 2